MNTQLSKLRMAIAAVSDLKSQSTLEPRLTLGRLFESLQWSDREQIDVMGLLESSSPTSAQENLQKLKEGVGRLLYQAELEEFRASTTERPDSLRRNCVQSSRLDHLPVLSGQRFKKAAVIGCGPLPLTALGLLTHEHSEEVILVDKSSEALDFALAFLQKNNPSWLPRITIANNLGQNLSYQNCDLVVMRSAVCPKLDIISSICRSKNSYQGFFVLDFPLGNSSLCYEEIDQKDLCGEFGLTMIRREVVKTPWFKKATVLLKRK